MSKQQILYSDEEKEYIFKLHEQGLIYREIAEKTNAKFGNNRTRKAIGSLIYVNGKARSSRYMPEYTKEELDFIRENIKNHTIKEVSEMLTKKFGTNRTRDGVKSVMEKHGIKTGRDGRFKPGDKPSNTKEVGSTRIDRDGYILVKIAEPNKWVHKHRVVYEEHHGVKLTKDDIIIFKDGDRTNVDIDNLLKIDRAVHIRMNTEGFRSGHPEILEAGIALTKLTMKAREVKDNKKEKRKWTITKYKQKGL